MRRVQPEKQHPIIYTAKSVVFVSLLFVISGLVFISSCLIGNDVVQAVHENQPRLQRFDANWKAPHDSEIPEGPAGEAIRYGRELIVNTGRYFGPNGKIAAVSNGMNCQNCHLNAGTKPFANNYSGFYANYPKKGARSGKTDEVTDRISDCFQRSLNGKMPDKSSKEIQAMVSYFKWVGQRVKKGEKPGGTATEKIPFLDRPADPVQGLLVYYKHCKSCHGAGGAGLKSSDGLHYIYPPLWGETAIMTVLVCIG